MYWKYIWSSSLSCRDVVTCYVYDNLKGTHQLYVTPPHNNRVNPQKATQLQVHYLCNVGRSSVSCSGSLVLGITPMMVLFSEVPFSSRSRTRCMFRGESTLNLTVEPGRRTPSWVSSNGRRLGIWIAPPETIVQFLFFKCRCPVTVL